MLTSSVGFRCILLLRVTPNTSSRETTIVPRFLYVNVFNNITNDNEYEKKCTSFNFAIDI